MPFHVKFNIFRVSHGCVMCRAISPEGAAAGSPERGHRQQPRVPKTREAHPLPSLLQTPHECPRSTSPGSSRLRTREGMAKEGSALGNCEGRVRRADNLCSLPMFMGCPVRHRTRSCCVAAPQDYLWGHVRRAAPGGWLLSAFYISL